MNFSKLPKQHQKSGFVEKNGKPNQIRHFYVEYPHATNFPLNVIFTLQKQFTQVKNCFLAKLV
jgi:hypothetical protein